jgi:DNA-binding MarR family transcriptional regulator
VEELSQSGMDRCHCAALRRAARRISQFYDEKLAPTGLRASQYGILVAIRDKGELSVNELAARLELDRTTTGKNLRPLERASYVHVAPSAKDGRSRRITLTAKGLARLKSAAPLWREAQSEFEESNGLERAVALRGTLASLRIGA